VSKKASDIPNGAEKGRLVGKIGAEGSMTTLGGFKKEKEDLGGMENLEREAIRESSFMGWRLSIRGERSSSGGVDEQGWAGDENREEWERRKSGEKKDNNTNEVVVNKGESLRGEKRRMVKTTGFPAVKKMKK